MILDLETEKAAGLDESQLAEQVMRLMNLSEMCEGPLAITSDAMGADYVYAACQSCDYGKGFGGHVRPPTSHPRVPKPLREVRDELIEWLGSQGYKTTALFYVFKDHRVLVGNTKRPVSDQATVVFTAISDFPLALALAAVRLLEEKQDG
jgi:hypothetical protein